MRGLRLYETARSRELRAARTPAEERLWGALRARRLAGYKFVRQLPIGPYFADFACREEALVVEVDGATHSTDQEVARDAHRDRILGEAGFRVLRIANDDVFHNLDGVKETILASLEQRETL